MASGNLGDLFVSLGIKDEMSETLRKIVKGMKGVDQATLDAKKQGEDLIKSLNGLNGNNFSKVFRDATKYIEDNSKGISNIISLLKKVEEKTDSNAITSKFFGVKELPRIAEYLTAINAEFAKMAKDEARADNIKAWQSRITNSLEYIKILQDIDLWQRKIDSTKANNPNVNSKSLDDAKRSLSEIRRQIVGLLSSGGVDTSGVLSNFSKFLSIARKEVNDVISTFKKENPLSSFSGGAAKVEADIARVGEKLAKLRDLMSEGSVKGYNTSMLGGNITELNNLLARLQSAQGNKNILTDEAQMKNLLSDVAVGMVKATAATQAYGREKGKVIAQEREHNKAIKEHNAVQSGDNKRVKALSEIEILLKNIQNLTEKSFRLGVDVNNINSVRSEIEAIKNALGSISGKDLAGQPLKDILGKLSEVKVRTNDILKTQSVLNKDAETRSATINRYKTDISEYVKAVERESEALLKNKKIRESVNSQKSQLDDWMMRNYRAGGYFGDKSAIEKEIKNLEQGIAQKKQIINDYYLYIVRKNSEIASLTSKAKAFSPFLNGRDANGTPLSGSDLGAYKLALSSVTSLKDELRRNTDPNGWGKFYYMNQASKDIAELTDKLYRANEIKNSLRDNKLPTGNTEIEKELSKYKSEIIRKNEELISSEKRMAEQIAKTNAARRESIATSRQQAESLVRDRIKELEAQRQQIQGLFGKGKNVLSEEELTQMKGVFSQLTQELNTLRSAMNNLGGYSIKELFSISRGTSDFSPMISSMDTVIKKKQEAIELERKHQQEIAASAAKARNDLASAFAGVNAEAKKMQSILGDVKSLFLQGGIVFGAQQFFNSIVHTGGEIVQQHVALRSILGDVQKADELFAQTQQLALQSPFKFGELNRDVKQLAAFGVEANDLYDTTKRLADIASGLGVSFERLGLAYGQVKARSWLDGKELRQFAYAGLPLLQRITELYNATGKNGRNDYTQADVKKMISNREVSFEDVQKVLWNMTDEGGQFYNMQFVLSETLLGKWNKLIDAWEIMLGKFADGKNVIGGTFKYAISGATDLILALDKLSPLLLSFGATFVARKGIGALYGNIAAKAGIGGILSSQKEAVNIRLREYAIQQQQLVAEKQITQEKATQKVAAMGYALTSKEEQINAMQRLALEGRLSMMQMQEAYRKGLITQELLSQLEVMGLISAKQKEIVANATIENRVRAIGMTAMSSVGKLFTWGNAAFLGISVAIGAIIHYFQKTEEIEQRSKDIATSAQQRINSLNDALSSANGINKDSEAPDIERVNEQLQSVLEQSGLFTDTIKEQIEQASTLTEKYQILKGAVSDAKNASSVQGKFADTISKAIDASGGFLNDDITENVKDVMDSYNKMQTLLAGLDEATKERMSSIANQFLKPEQASLSLEEKIDLLADMSEEDFDKFVRAASNGSNDIAHSLYLIRDRANITKDHFNEIAKDDVPKILEVIRIALGKNEKEFRHWAQHNIKSFDSMFMKIIELCNANVPTIVTKLRKIFYESVGMEPPKEPSKGGNKPKPYNSGLKAGGAGENARKKLQKSGKLNKTNYKAYDAELQIYDSDSSEEFGENLRKRYKEIRNENNARKKAGRKVSAESIARQKRIEEIAAVSGVSLDVGKDKVTGDFGKDGKNGRQEDTLLKNLQERLSSLKSARQMYQKFNTILPDEEARKRTYEQFPEVVGLDLKDYQVAVRKLLEKFNANTPERRKFRTSVYREVAEWLFSEKDKKEYDKKAADFSEYMNRLSNQWDLYKSLLEKTGNKNYAGAAWIDAFQMDEKTKSLMDAYYHQYGKLFNMQEAISLTDGEAKEKLKGHGEYEAWKKIVDLLRNNYVQSLQDGADAMQQTMSVAQKLDSITEKYAKKRKDAGANQDLIDRYDFLEKQEKSGVLFDKMKSEVNWDGVFGNLGNYTKKELKKVRKDINSLISGGLLNGMSTTDIKSIYDGLGKLNQAIDGEGFSGLSDLLKDLIDASEKYDEAVKAYNDTVKKYGKDSWQAEQARKSMLQTDQRRRGAQGTVNDKKLANANNIFKLADMFRTLGSSDGSGSTLLQNAGSWTSSIMQMFGSDKNGSNNSQIVGGIVGMFAGLTEAIAQKGFGGFLSDAFEDIGGAVNSIFKDVLGINLGISGADYSDYNDAKEEYNNLISVWDSLISKKTEYMNIHWGTEATEASKEAQAMLEAEIEQTKIIAQKRLSSGASVGSHSIGYRMWKGSYKYDGQNWRDVASDISSKYGVRFNGMEDLLNMNSDTLSKIKQDYTGLWATMDGDYRDYLEKLIEYGDKADEMVENLTEKLTGNKFSSLVESWGDAMASMANSSDNLVDNFENNLKKTIINSMIEDMYGDKIKAILAKAKKYGDKDESENWYVGGEYMGAWTPAENAEVKSDIEDVAKQIEATRDFFKKSYGWSDNSSSSSTNSVKGITEETANLLASYANAIRLDCSVIRAEQAKFFPEMSEIAKSQLTQLNQISQHTLRNAEAAERIETVVTSLNDNFNRVINGAKVLHVK